MPMTLPYDIRVVVQIAGGLGNQLFQYAAGRALAHRLGASLVLDCSPRPIGRPFALDRFPIKARLIHDAPASVRLHRFRLPGKLGRRVTDACHDIFPKTARINGHRLRISYEKQPFTYDPQFERLSGSIYLVGWLQTYRYFKTVAGLIRADLQMAEPRSNANRQWLERIRHENSVCLHVRRGDYLEPYAQALFGLCAPSYYAAAAAMMRERLDRPRFFVFSNDLAWCRNHLPVTDLQFVDANSSDDPVDELQLMATCRHHIIANSSFSWWAAWLAARPDQTVIAPDPWFIDEPANGLIPDGWIRLPRD